MNEEQNRRLTQVGRGTPMGEVLRRHWMPIAGASELDENPIKPLRLMGEDLVLYRDLSGNHGLVERACAHRRADLSYGFVEADGIRCSYHGWAFNASGKCVSRPYEDTINPEITKRGRICIQGYPVKEKAGLLWAYLGPAPAPELPDWEPFSFENGFVQIVVSDVPCNWLQCQENSIDPVHFEWMHNNWSTRLSGQTGPYSAEHKEVAFEEFDHGLVYKRIRGEATKADAMWTVGRVCLWPNAFFLGDHFEYRVPIDDENTLSISWIFTRLPQEVESYSQPSVPTWRSPVKDDATGRWVTSHVINQDMVAWVGQGVIADRTKETLGLSDRGIVMLRRRFEQDIAAVERGEDPKGVIRDPAKNVRVQLPIAEREFLLRGLPRQVLLAHPIWRQHYEGFRFAYGQPESVRQAFREAAGL